MIARPPKSHILVFSSAGLDNHQALSFFEHYQVNRIDKGKSARKTEAQNHGSKAAFRGHDRQVTENELSRLAAHL
jgi:hypothetical protein